MPRPKTTKKSPRTIGKGVIVRIPSTQVDEVVRDVSVVLHMANGQDVVYNAYTDEVALVEVPALEEVEALFEPPKA